MYLFRLCYQMKLLHIFLLLLSSPLFYSINMDDSVGNPADNYDSENLYQGVVYIKSGNTVCSGTLINNRTVLTAAHCLIEGQSVEVYFGLDAKNPDFIVEATSFIKNPEDKRYSSFQGASYDVALISLKRPVYEVQAYSLATEQPELNQDITVSGYGLHGTGSVPDQKFDKKRRVGTNNLEIISFEEDLLGSATESSTEDEIIFGYFFDNISGDSSEASLTLGDSGSPLLIDLNSSFLVLGVGSWIRSDVVNFNNGYGATAGYASVPKNLNWINANNPLKKSASIDSGFWEDQSTWSSDYIPNNFYNVLSGSDFNSISARYYEVNLTKKITLASYSQIDRLMLSLENTYLHILSNATLEVLDNTSLNNGSILIDGAFSADSMSIDTGTLSGTGTLSVNKAITVASGIISPGNETSLIGSLSIQGNLVTTNNSTLIINTTLSSKDSVSVNGGALIAGTLNITPLNLSDRYSGNTEFILFTAKSLEGVFTKFTLDNTEIYGKLIHEIFYTNNTINWKLKNPSYRNLGLLDIAKGVGGHIDAFTENTSLNFQELLDKINYLDSNLIDNALTSLLPNTNFKSDIKIHGYLRINPYLEDGLLVTRSNLSDTQSHSSFDSKIKTLYYKTNNLTFSHGVIDTTNIYNNEKGLTDSTTSSLTFQNSTRLFDYSLSYRDTKHNSLFSGFYLVGNFSYERKKTLNARSSSFDINLSKTKNFLETEFYIGFNSSFGTYKTDPFKEEINLAFSDHEINDIKFKSLEPFIGINKKIDLGYGRLKIEGLLSYEDISLGKVYLSSKFDNANNFLSSSLGNDLNKDISLMAGVTFISPDSIYFKLHQYKEGEFKSTEIGFGLLF